MDESWECKPRPSPMVKAFLIVGLPLSYLLNDIWSIHVKSPGHWYYGLAPAPSPWVALVPAACSLIYSWAAFAFLYRRLARSMVLWLLVWILGAQLSYYVAIGWLIPSWYRHA